MTEADFHTEKQLTIGMDLGDRFNYYCVLDGAGEVIVEQRLATTKQAIEQLFGRMPRSRVALETGAHSPWVSRLLTELGHEVIVAHARNVWLIGESSRKDDHLDPRMLARLRGEVPFAKLTNKFDATAVPDRNQLRRTQLVSTPVI